MPQNTPPRSRKPGTPAGTAGAPAEPAAKAGAAKATGATRSSGATKAASSTRSPGKATARPSGRPPVKAAGGRPGGPRPKSGRPGKPKSIVNQRQRPWGLIVTVVIVVLFAGGVIGFAVTRSGKPSTADAAYTRDEIAAASAISGVTYKKEPNHNHVSKKVNYDSSPPIGGNHAQYWADCTGTVYPNQIANENAVHALEHGAVWITYQPGLSAADVAVLAKKVTGIDRMLMSPYAGLKTKVSLQSWGYQLFVDSVTDPKIDQFIKALRFNPGTTPEPSASCSNPAFKTSPSTPANPTF